jgi:hypothetical protein
MRKIYYLVWASLCLLLLWGAVSQAQYSVNEKIEAEDLYEGRVVCSGGTDWLRVSHGEDWTDLDHPSNFLYAMCGNRHWLCDYRTVPRCQYACADVYVSASITIPEEADYVIYAYVANWSDSAVIEGNRGCNRNDKWECAGWYIVWDDVGVLDKPSQDETLPRDHAWPIYPHDRYCGEFGLDTVSINHDRTECPGGDPRGCDFPGTRFHLKAGEHTLYLKVMDEYTLLDWLLVAKDADSVPAAEPGRLWKTGVESRVVPKPESFVLEQNYPNPFNAETTINYFLPRTSIVSLVVYNVEGQEVSVLVNSQQPRGHHSVRFDVSGLPSGMYLYKLEARCTACGGSTRTLFSEKKEMVLVK